MPAGCTSASPQPAPSQPPWSRYGPFKRCSDARTGSLSARRDQLRSLLRRHRLFRPCHLFMIVASLRRRLPNTGHDHGTARSRAVREGHPGISCGPVLGGQSNRGGLPTSAGDHVAVGWKSGARWKFGAQIRHPYFHTALILHSKHTSGAYMGGRDRVDGRNALDCALTWPGGLTGPITQSTRYGDARQGRVRSRASASEGPREGVCA